MKKLLLLITALFILASVEGQILRYGNYTSPPTPPSGDYCAEFDTVYAAFDTKPHADTAAFMNAMVYSLDTAGYWDRIDVFYVFAVHEADDESLINWIDPGTYDATNISSTAFTRYGGYTGDASADYLAIDWTASTQGENYALDDASYGIYTTLNIQDNVPILSFGGTNTSNLTVRSTGNNMTAVINTTAANYVRKTSVTDGTGLIIVTRRASNDSELYQNGSSLASDSDASVGLPATPITILRLGSGYSANNVLLFFVMDGMSDTDATEISTIIETYMSAIGAGVV